MTRSLQHIFFDPKLLGRKMKEISVDVIRTERQQITSRWFHAADADLFIWQDEKYYVIKQQVNFSGLIIEWNVVDGLRTGLLVEEEQNDKQGIPPSEVIRYDSRPSNNSIQQAVDLIQSLEVIDEGIQKVLLHNLQHSPSLDTMSSKEIFQRYDYLKGSRSPSLWKKMKSLFKKKSS